MKLLNLLSEKPLHARTKMSVQIPVIHPWQLTNGGIDDLPPIQGDH